MKATFLGYACAIGAAVFWGFHSVIIRMLIHEGVDPFLIGETRLLIGSGVLAVGIAAVSFIRRQAYPSVRYSTFFWLIALSLAVNFLLFHKGLQYTIASDAVLLEAFSPVMVLIVVMLFLPHRIRHLLIHPGLPWRILSVVIIGSIGSSLLLINDPKDLLTARENKLLGDLIELIAMFTWALVMLGMHEYQRKEPNSNLFAATSQFLFCAALFMAPFVPWHELSALTYHQWLWMAVFGIFSTAGSYVLWHYASKYLDVLPLVTVFNLVGVLTVITESLVLGLGISWKLLVGGSLILYSATRAKMINTQYKILAKDEMPAE